MSDSGWLEEVDESEQLVLSDLINRVLDKGVVINSHIVISIADIDLIELDLKLLVSAVATLQKRRQEHGADVSVRADTRP